MRSREPAPEGTPRPDGGLAVGVSPSSRSAIDSFNIFVRDKEVEPRDDMGSELLLYLKDRQTKS